MASILIIDDEIANTELVEIYLGGIGHQTHVAHSGVDGYDMAQEFDVDLILLDLRMPDYSWSGYTTAMKLKTNQRTQHIPVIAVTASGDVVQALEAGCDDVLMRPFRQKQLYKIIKHYLIEEC